MKLPSDIYAEEDEAKSAAEDAAASEAKARDSKIRALAQMASYSMSPQVQVVQVSEPKPGRSASGAKAEDKRYKNAEWVDDGKPYLKRESGGEAASSSGRRDLLSEADAWRMRYLAEAEGKDRVSDAAKAVASAVDEGVSTPAMITGMWQANPMSSAYQIGSGIGQKLADSEKGDDESRPGPVKAPFRTFSRDRAK